MKRSHFVPQFMKLFGMKVTTSSIGKRHGLVLSKKMRSGGWNRMMRRHEG